MSEADFGSLERNGITGHKEFELYYNLNCRSLVNESMRKFIKTVAHVHKPRCMDAHRCTLFWLFHYDVMVLILLKIYFNRPSKNYFSIWRNIDRKSFFTFSQEIPTSCRHTRWSCLFWLFKNDLMAFITAHIYFNRTSESYFFGWRKFRNGYWNFAQKIPLLTVFNW